MIANHTGAGRRSHGRRSCHRPAAQQMLTNKTLAFTLAVILAALSVAGTAHAQFPSPLPTPTVVPTLTPHPLPTPRSFHCNCFRSGQPVAWAGQVQASSFFQARQAAAGACMAALGARPGAPPLLRPAPFAVPTLEPPLFNPCSNCACN